MRRPKIPLQTLRRVRPQRSEKPLTQQFRSYHSSRVNRPSDDSAALRAPREETSSRSGRTSVSTHLMRLIAAGLLLYALYAFIVLDTNVNITPLSANSDTQLLRPRDEYRRTAQSIMASSPAFRTKLTIDTRDFEAQMLQAFPEIAQARLSLPLLGHRPILDVVAKEPSLILRDGTNAYLIDKNGQAMMRASEAAGLDGLEIPAIEDQSGLEIKQGKVVLTSQSVSFLKEFHRLAAAVPLAVESYVIPAAFNEVQVKFRDTPYSVKLLTDNDPRQTIGEYLALTQKLRQERRVPSEYIDLRVSERAYYK